MAIDNTENKNPLAALFAMSKHSNDFILNQEKEGQGQMVQSAQLPRLTNYDKEAREYYEDWGIKVFGVTKDDEIFVDVQLPKGWKKERTEHSMWSKVLDEKGRERLKVFYKAAFYDRSAHVQVQTFINRGVQMVSYWNGEYSDKNSPLEARVTNANGEMIYKESGETFKKYSKEYFNEKNRLKKNMEKWLKVNYPEYQSHKFYWN